MSEIESGSAAVDSATAALEIMTGPARGTVAWLSEAVLDVSLNDADMIRIAAPGSEPLKDGVVARLRRSAGSYEIEALEGNPLWINGDRVDSKQLEQRDLVEFGEKGPLSRFRLYRQGDRLRRSLGDMYDDAIDYARVSRKPRPARLQMALRTFCKDFLVETTLMFRIGVILALTALAIIAYQQYRASVELQRQAESSAYRLEDFARTLTRAGEEALRPSDLNRLRKELSHSLSDTAARLEQLEKRGAASTRIIAEATQSIVFLQGAYGFRDIETRRMLRYRTDEQGSPLFTLRGQPLLTLEGDGEIAKRTFTGTAFVISSSGTLLTNRHVALPWEDDNGAAALIAEGMEPVMIKFVGYLPGIEDSFAVELFKASEVTDLAVMRCAEVAGGLPYLKLSERQPQPGDEVIVMGYPTGMRALLAQTGDSFLAELEQDENLDFWGIAEHLSKAHFIRPLATRGIVGQRSEAMMVYDAETTHGGSGGPVLDINGDTIAINTAIMPEYGGSNFGIPVEHARRLLIAAGVEVD